jgi:diphthamide synthase (EF-2-diphthine--ammonia ligase)
MEEFIESGFKAAIVALNRDKLPERFLGRLIDSPLIRELEAEGIDACGEGGEYHSFVFDGPLFRVPVPYLSENIHRFDQYSFIAVHIDPVIQEASP